MAAEIWTITPSLTASGQLPPSFTSQTFTSGLVGQGQSLEQVKGMDSDSKGGGAKPTGWRYLGTHSSPEPPGRDSRRLESLVQCFPTFLML